VTTGYKIKEVADRSGFTTATLRYYEEIGLLPESPRTTGGYRLYDDHTLDRLAFIARAKQLGCTLEEVADLTLAWDGGQCGPVQDRLRLLVADKLARARQQIAELTTLVHELDHAAATLDRHRPDGPCDDECGCVTDAASEAPRPQTVSLVIKPTAVDEPLPNACALGTSS
jgi:MerR family copper efflux transcriptional regulator